MSIHNGIDIAQWRAQVSLPASAAAGVHGHPKVAPLAGFGALPPSLTLLPVKVRPAHAKPVALSPSAPNDDDEACGSSTTDDDGRVPGLTHSLATGSSDDSSSAGPTSPSEVEDDAHVVAATAANLATIVPEPSVAMSAPAKAASCARDEREAKKVEADRLVDATLDLLNAIWHRPSSPAAESSEEGGVSLRTFVNEILRRSRSSCATLRAARWYLERAAVLLPVERAAEREGSLACPRRTFLSALVLANKFLHDRVYSNKAWGKVSGLETTEISLGELALGSLLDWALWVRDEPVVVVVPAAYAAPEPSTSAPELVPLKSKRSWQPKRPLGPGRHDRAFRSTLGDYPPTPSVPSVLAGESSQHQPAKRRFSASKSFSPSTAAAAASKEHVSKRARVVEVEVAEQEASQGGFVVAVADEQAQPLSGVVVAGADEDALVAQWETRMAAILAA